MNTSARAQAPNNSPELVSVGRISVDLYGEQLGQDLRTTNTFRRYIGGSAGNIAVGASRLGLNTAMVARIGADGFGDYLVDELEREGISTEGVIRDDHRSTGTIVLAMHEGSDFPRTFLVQDPAEFNLSSDDIDTGLIERARAVVLTGSMLSRENLAGAANKVLQAARQGGTKVIFDIDYRPAFWGVAPRTRGENLVDYTPQVTKQLQTVLPDCDVVIGTEAEICALGGDKDVMAALRKIRSLTAATVIYKTGPDGCYAYSSEIPDALESGLHSPGFNVQVVNSVGAGDGFMSGFLRGYLRGESLPTSLRWANASGAIVVGRLACSGDSPSKAELDEFLDAAVATKSGDAASTSSSLSFDTATRHRNRESLCVLALDHRGHLERVATHHGAGAAEITRFKTITIEGFLNAYTGDSRAGILLDDLYVPSTVRELVANSGVWNARALELNGTAPVRFAGGPDVAGYLRSWPKEQVVKVLMSADPFQDPVVTFENRRRLAMLSEVCRNQERDLFVEILPGPGQRNTGSDFAEIIDDWYDAGIQPAWWKLPGLDNSDDWVMLDKLVSNRDPGCRGFVILGGSIDGDGLKASFINTAGLERVRGFAVGRPIFHAPAVEWFAGKIDDAEAQSRILARYREVIDLWQARE